jgi:hypothetical protein
MREITMVDYDKAVCEILWDKNLNEDDKYAKLLSLNQSVALVSFNKDKEKED